MIQTAKTSHQLTFIFKVQDNFFSSMDPAALRYLNLNGSKWVTCSSSTTFPFTADLKKATLNDDKNQLIFQPIMNVNIQIP